MQFRLPSSLQTELISYDPALKKLRTQKKSTNGKTKSKYPLGNPKDIIPADVVKPEQLQKAIDYINTQGIENRHSKFDRFVPDGPGFKSETLAILYHYESCWYACWLPPKGKEGEYIYGFTFAYKDVAASKAVPNSVTHRVTRYGELKHYGRVTMKSLTKLVTIDDLKRSDVRWDFPGWNMPGVSSWGKGQYIITVINAFYKSLKAAVPSWEDSNGTFDRIRCRGIADVLFERGSVAPQSAYWNSTDINGWKIDVSSFFNIIQSPDNTHTEFNKYKDIMHIIDKPFFRKWMQLAFDTCNNRFENKDNNSKSAIAEPYLQVLFVLDQIHQLNTIWPDTPIDYYQNNIDLLLKVNFLRYSHNGYEALVIDWLRSNMPAASFFNNLRNIYDKDFQNNSCCLDRYLGIKQLRFHDWRDTCDMLYALLYAGKTVEPPRRWRIAEFHDHVQAEAWKIKNPNHGLPQDLFPNPVRIEIDGTKLSFFQPVDTHQLAQWGAAARNCVGSAGSYAEGVKKKKHFIVLCMVDGKPKYTVQLTVNNGLMEVKQIAGISNTRLTDEERELYTKAFGKALRKRGDELKSAA